MQSYDRYSPDETLGIIASPDSNAIFDSTGKLAFTGAVQSVNVWNLRQASLTKTLKYDDINYPYSDFGEVISLLRLPDRTSIAAGYTSGEVRIFNYIQGTLTTTFRGHRSAVTSLAVDEKSDGSLLATGGADCDIIIWDLISLSGVARFHDHKDAVTGLAFLNRGDQKLLLSSSKDTLLKVWDLDSRCCIQTIVGHRAEIWSIAVLHGSLSETSKMRVFTGAADELIRVYKVNDAPSSSSGKKRSHDTATANTIEDEEVLTYFGALERSSGADRCSSLSINVSNNLLGAQSSGKYVDIFRLRDATEAKKKMKRRIKRSQNKANNNDDNSDNETTHADQEILIVDEIELVTTMKLASKVRSFSFNPMSFTAQEDLALIAYVNNSLEIHKIPHSIDKGVPMKLSLIDLPGHRSDVRSIAISPEHHTVVTSSSEALKLWTTRGLQCTGSCYSDGSYCLSVGFVPGGRHVLCGTKDGKLKVFDFASGDCVVTVDDAHPNAAIWAIAVRPDGRGFVTASADKTVKFWNFNLASDKLSVDLDRQLVLPADVLTVRFNHTKHQSQLLLAVGLLDNTVRIFYDDSLKLFLTLYGHKLPVMCVDMSYDHRLLVSGSADKTVKIWGLDFGDCHRSLFGHSDSVTAVRFVNNTHYFFSASKDGTIRYWDADRFEQILLLTGHKGAVWSLDVSNNGRHLFSSGQDRSIRVWTRTDDLVFIEEEKERMLESQADKAATADTNQQIVTYDRENSGGLFSGANKSQTMIASMSSIDSIRSGESLMAAIDLVEETLTSVKEKYRQTVDKDPTILTKDEKARKEIYEKIEKEISQVNPMFLQLTPFPYLQRNLRQIKLPDLEPALLLLPFHYIKRFFPLITELLRRGYDLELNSRIVLFLLTIHSNQIIATKAFMKELLELQDLLFQNLFAYRNLIGMNQMGFWFMTQQIQRGNEDVQAVTEVSKGVSGSLPAGLITSLTPEMGINADKIAHLDGSNFTQNAASHQNHQTVKAVEQRSAKKAKLV